MRTFGWLVLMLGVTLTGVGCGRAAPPAPGGQGSAPSGQALVRVEIGFLNHGPLRPVLRQIDSALAPYSQAIQVIRYDFETSEGEVFVRGKGLQGHTPLVIFVNGTQTFSVGGRTVTFESFPKGEGTGMVPDGTWTIADLEAVLKQATAH
jgi:hypothetical protein